MSGGPTAPGRLIESALGPGRAGRLQDQGLDLVEDRREGSWVWDGEGNRYLDCHGSSGTFILGRRHPVLAGALVEAARATDQGNFPLISIEKAGLARALCRFAPSGLDHALFSVTRGETVDFACKLARGATARTRIVAAEGGWHGQTGFAFSITERNDRGRYAPLITDVGTLPFNDTDAVVRRVTFETAAVILEPVQAENRCQTASAQFLRALRWRCNETGALLVLDETQTGFGRTGRRFACDAAGVAPDVLIVGESLGGGLFPIAATLYGKRGSRFMNAHPLIHLSTFGGSDVGCRVGRAVIELLERERPWLNAAAQGERLQTGLNGLAGEFPDRLRSVAGAGLLLSLDCGTPALAERFCARLRRAGVIAATGRVARQTVVLRPSLLLSDAEADHLLAAVAAALRQPEEERPGL